MATDTCTQIVFNLQDTPRRWCEWAVSDCSPTVANYCLAAKIPYPADLTKGNRQEEKAGPTQGTATQPPKATTPLPKPPLGQKPKITPLTPKIPKKDIKGGKHSKPQAQSPSLTLPKPCPPPPPQSIDTPAARPQMPLPSTSVSQDHTPHRPVAQGGPIPQQPPTTITLTHTFAEFCTEVTTAIHPALHKLIQDAMSKTQGHLQAQIPQPAQLPAHKRQRLGDLNQAGF